MLKTALNKINKTLKKNSKRNTILFILIFFFLVFSFSSVVFLRSRSNDDIHFLQTNSNVILGNQNPNFNVSFGKRDEPSKQWVRFEAKGSVQNPFSEQERGFFTKLLDIFRPKRSYGIEMSLQGVGLGHVEELDLGGAEEKVKGVAEYIGDAEIITSTELVEKGRVIGSYDSEEPVSKKTVVNRNVADGVDIEYQILEGIGLKEEIVIRNLEEYTKECGEDLIDCKLPLNEFVFNLKLNEGLELRKGLYTVKGKTSEAYFFEDSNGNYVAHFLPSWAMDSVGDKTYDVILDVSEKGVGNYEVKVIVNINWLFSHERVYPVRIDPTIVHDTKVEFDEGIFERT